MNVMEKKPINITFVLIALFFSFSAIAQQEAKNRLVVITDIGNEPDDLQSMVRLMLYSNKIDIEGIIASTSIHQKSNVSPDLIKKVIDAYAKVRPNLLKHESGFPTSSYLLSRIRTGLPVYGMEGVGEGKDSEGSEWIIEMLEKEDDRPLWISVWGGPNTLAQALWKLKKTRSENELNKLISKLRVYTISDQDNTGHWIRKNFKDLFYIVSPGQYEDATWSAIAHPQEGANNKVISNDWITQNIQQGHGPLGSLYPDVAYGVEGDTPSFLGLVPNGLNEPEHPDWGGWGGRYEFYLPEFKPKSMPWMVRMEEETRPIWTNTEDVYTPYVWAQYGRSQVRDTISFTGNHVTLWRWREDFQNDFAARIAWCNTDYEDANHPPIDTHNGTQKLIVESGKTFDLDATAFYDPDGDGVSFLWFQYPEVGSYKRKIRIDPENVSRIHNIRAPIVDSVQTIHFIVKVTDKGMPRLTRYRRVIVTITP